MKRYFRKTTVLKRQSFGHLMSRADALEKTLMLGKIEGGRRRGQQRMRWLDGITGSMDMCLRKLGETVRDRKLGVLPSLGSQRVGHDLPATAQDSAKRCAWQGFRSGGGGGEEAEERGAGRQVDTEGGGAVRRETSGKKDWSAVTTTTSNEANRPLRRARGGRKNCSGSARRAGAAGRRSPRVLGVYRKPSTQQARKGRLNATRRKRGPVRRLSAVRCFPGACVPAAAAQPRSPFSLRRRGGQPRAAAWGRGEPGRGGVLARRRRTLGGPRRVYRFCLQRLRWLWLGEPFTRLHGDLGARMDPPGPGGKRPGRARRPRRRQQRQDGAEAAGP
ncbi:hypothetical protein AB1E18_015368 [Capra hircus]